MGGMAAEDGCRAGRSKLRQGKVKIGGAMVEYTSYVNNACIVE
jgi:hypothetical protein